MKTGSAMSEQEYLTNPAYEHCEYVGGGILEKPKGTGKHGQLELRFGMLLYAFAESKGLYLGSELHCRLLVEGELSFVYPMSR